MRLERHCRHRSLSGGFAISGCRVQLHRNLRLGRNSYTDAPLVPFKGYGQMSYMKVDGTANYNSLQTPLQRRLTKRLTLGAVYTWSHSQPQRTRIKTRRIRLIHLLDYPSASWHLRHVCGRNLSMETVANKSTPISFELRVCNFKRAQP